MVWPVTSAPVSVLWLPASVTRCGNTLGSCIRVSLPILPPSLSNSVFLRQCPLTLFLCLAQVFAVTLDDPDYPRSEQEPELAGRKGNMRKHSLPTVHVNAPTSMFDHNLFEHFMTTKIITVVLGSLTG